MTSAGDQTLKVTDYTAKYVSGEKNSTSPGDYATYGPLGYTLSWGSKTDKVYPDGHILSHIIVYVGTSEGGDSEGSVSASVSVVAVKKDGTRTSLGDISKGYSHNWTHSSKQISLKDIDDLDYVEVTMSTSSSYENESAYAKYTVYDYLSSWEY